MYFVPYTNSLINGNTMCLRYRKVLQGVHIETLFFYHFGNFGMLYIAHWSNPMVVRIEHYSPLVSDMLQTVTGKDSDYNGMGRIHARLRQ